MDRVFKFVGSLISHIDYVSKLWHDRFGHVDYIAFQEMIDDNMVRGLQKISSLEGVCEGYVLGKRHRGHFPSRKAWRDTHTLQIIHGYFCIPMHSPWFFFCQVSISFD